MTIAFVPNDPLAGTAAPKLRRIAPSANRPANRSSFTFSDASPEGEAAPGTAQFLFWQAREAAILALRAFEASAGSHKAWQGNRKKIALLQDAGEDLNAYYDRESVSFFHAPAGNQVYFSGASTDVVAHEVGHGLLDSLRPDLWDINFLEAGAFHEAFGDCIAILTALHDQETRKKLLAKAPNLRSRNFVESTAEELSKAIGVAFPGHNAAQPRRAFNSFKYQIPSTLPSNGGPGELINEAHSFGMLFTGPFWDLIANMYAASPQKNEAALLAVAKAAGKILIAGAAGAIVTPRFLQSVGRAMTLADQSQNGGANRDAIRDAFGRHDISLGANAILAPSTALAGPAPRRAKLSAATRKDVQTRMGTTGAKMEVNKADMFGTPMLEAVQTRAVSLTGMHPQLKGVVAMAHEQVMIGASGTRAAVMGAMPHPPNTDSEIEAFVESLLAHRRIRFAKSAKAAAAPKYDHATHAIVSVGGKKVLRRIRFGCACGRAARLATRPGP